MKTNSLAILLLAIGLGSLVMGLGYSVYAAMSHVQSENWNKEYGKQWMMSGWSQQPQVQANSSISLEQAETIVQQYLASTQNSNLAIMEIMEFQNNFYIMYCEKDTGLDAFEMLIWKQTPPSGMMSGGMGMVGGMMNTGVIMPEPGPNMMWNTKYSNMGSGMMGQGMMGTRNQAYSTMTVTKEKALTIGQAYLDSNLNGAKVEDAMQFYGYYTIDFTINGKISGMLSVNGYSGEVWYHSWHGIFIQEVEFD